MDKVETPSAARKNFIRPGVVIPFAHGPLEGIVELQECIGDEPLKQRNANRDARKPIVVGGGDPVRRPADDPM